jgi:protein tyrosine phosphatase (PTP) superfamily phosphohydrolase (DUF442 family)
MMPPSELAGPQSPAPRRRRRWLRFVLVLAGFGIVGLLGPEVYRVCFGSNWHVVLPGRVYRSAQLSPARLKQLADRYGIRTVINLRGNCQPDPWYVGECQTAHESGMGMEDVSLSASRYPSCTELRRLVEVFDHADYPVLLHCRRGADRTGLAATVALLLQPGVTLSQARWQLGPRYGHVPLLRTGSLDAFWDLYAAWLHREGKDHTPAVFRDWVKNHYQPGPCCATFERWPRRIGPVPPGQPQAVAVRVRNDSPETWHFRPMENAGIHLGFLLYDHKGTKIATGRAGLFARDVAPGESIDLTVPLPGIREPGSYHLFLDMIEEGQVYFYQMGSEPCDCEVIIGE